MYAKQRAETSSLSGAKVRTDGLAYSCCRIEPCHVTSNFIGDPILTVRVVLKVLGACVTSTSFSVSHSLHGTGPGRREGRIGGRSADNYAGSPSLTVHNL